MALTLQATVLLFAFLGRDFSDAVLCPQGRDVVIHRDYKSGEQLCCQAIRCEPGHEAVACRPDDAYSTTCRPCPENTFQAEFTSSVEMMPCSRKQTCREGMKVENDLSPVKDRKCICNVEQGLCNSSRSRSQFCQLGNCSAGLQLNPDCSCSECVNGFFKETNGSSRCRRWRNCEEEGQETLVEGSSVTDRVCGQQIDGTGKNVLPSPFEPVSTNNTTSSDLPKTTEMADRNESTVAKDGDTWTWISAVPIACAVIMLIIAVAVVVLVAKRKCWRTSKNPRVVNQPRPVENQPRLVEIRMQETDAEAGANERENEDSAFLEMLETQPEQNQTPEKNPLLGGSDNQEDASNTTIGQLPTLPTENTINETDTPVKQIACSSIGPLYKVSDWKERLNSCRVSLISNVYYSSKFISYLMVNETITDEMKESIEARETERIDKLLHYLPRRPSYAFPTFVLALVLTNQSHLAKRIHADMATEFDEKRDYLEENHQEVLQNFRKSYS